MGVRTPFYFVICVDDDEEVAESAPQPTMDADLYNYYYGDDDDEEDDHDDGVYSESSSCLDYDDNSSLLDDIDSVYGDDLDECDFDIDFPSYSKREVLHPFQQYNATLPVDSDEYFNDYEDDEYSLPSEEWEETINDARREAVDETSVLSVMVDKQTRRRHGRRETTDVL
ncbi:unnamed protein product [Cylindrotheca closterium]|uniref:Uncharacterized protein n=1 Tax=Cylindrotheca closterium TaxID=2856 RepID=A0AAD2FWQ8_9STRA|nr:unnamed protein product [Cylindrotheca closterium]